MADLHSKILDAPPPVQILSISCSFRENLAKSYVGVPPESWCPLLGEILDPPLLILPCFKKDKLNENYTPPINFQRTVLSCAFSPEVMHCSFVSFCCTSLGAKILRCSSPGSGGSKGGARDERSRGTQILSISCSFWENMAKSYVGAPREFARFIRTVCMRRIR